MNPTPRTNEPQEIELKLSLPGAASAGLARRLARLPVLARHKATRESLYNIYFDTPEQTLQQQRIALRLRRIGSAASPQWRQTLKTGMSDQAALSRRGEWETAVGSAALDQDALKLTPWVDIDPDGKLFDGLLPCFVTAFDRTIWRLNRPDGSVVEVALDIGQLEANGRQAPICELELELKAGSSAALFELAREIAGSLAVLPANQSKAQRGFLLAQDGLNRPQRAQSPRLSPNLSGPELAQRVLREMFAQFTSNLNALALSDDPEIVHQARVGWRRFKSALRLLRKIAAVAAPPDRLDLQPLLAFLSDLRNIDVALTETLPPLASGYCRGDEQRFEIWQAMLTALTQAAALQRKAVRDALQEPGVGLNLLLITEWLDALPGSNGTVTEKKVMLRHWAKRRILRLHDRLQTAQKDATTQAQQHQVRILAKRLRYGVEALRDLLPKRLADFCYEHAAGIQSAIGATRDLTQVSSLVASLELNPGIAEFLHGVAVGSKRASTIAQAPDSLSSS